MAQQIPFDDERYLLMELEEQVRTSQRVENGIEFIHMAALASGVAVLMVIGLSEMGSAGTGLGLIFGFLTFVALVINRSVRPLLSDLYRQFHYREKFALFLAHLLFFFLPMVMVPGATFDVMLGALLVVISFEMIDRTWAGRFLAAQVFIMMYYGLNLIMPEGTLVALWFFFLLVSIRFGHLRFRLENQGHGTDMSLMGFLIRSLVPCLLPTIVGYLAYLWSVDALDPRGWAMDYDRRAVRNPNDVSFSMSEILWTALGLVVLIIALLAFLSWLEQKLRKHQKGAVLTIDEISSSLRSYTEKATSGSRIDKEPLKGTRERILLAFAKLSVELKKLGLERHGEETAEEYLRRIAGVNELSPESAIFNNACYDHQEPDEKAADFFESRVEEIRRELFSKGRT